MEVTQELAVSATPAAQNRRLGRSAPRGCFFAELW